MIPFGATRSTRDGAIPVASPSGSARSPPDPKELADRLEGLIEHPMLTETPVSHREHDVTLRGMEEMLELLFARNGASMEEPRPPEQRLLCLCRHFALLAVAVCREWRVPARLRVGFADYFTPGFREDHWVAEIWTAEAGWRLADTQLGPAQRERFAIDFPIERGSQRAFHGRRRCLARLAGRRDRG